MVEGPENTVVEGDDDVEQTSLLLDEINTSTKNVAVLVENMIRKVKAGELNTSQGLSFLEMKNHTLLSYLINLYYVVSLKLSGKKIENDPSIERLIENRTVLEKIRPIDQKLKLQIDRLVKSAAGGPGDSTKKFQANLGNMEIDGDDNEDEGSENDDHSEDEEESAAKSKSGVYIPPKLSAVHYPGDENAFERNKRLQDRSKKHAVSSAIMQDLCEEYLDTPVEVHQGSRAQQLLTKQQRERQEYEEEYLTRLPVTKAEKHANRKLTTLGTLGAEVTDYRASGSGGKRKRKVSTKSKGKSSKKKRFSH